MSRKRHAVIAILIIVGGTACGVGGAMLGAALLSGCGGQQQQQPLIAPNQPGADCLADRQILTATCIRNYATRERIEQCVNDAKLPDCSTEAGIAAYVTSRADAGTNK